MKMLSRFPAVLILMVATMFAAAGKKHMTIEDSLAIKSIGSPQWSPDGRWIAYTLSEWDTENDKRVSHIYLAPASGGPSVKLTNGEKGETAPQWSPDGKWLSFLADRDKGNQIWLISPTGGEADKLTKEDEAVGAYRWSPDSKRIAFATRDTWKDKAEREKKKKEKFDAIVVDTDFRYTHLWTIALEGKEKKRITEGPFAVSVTQWSPDGKWIAYVSTSNGTQESSYTDISEDSNTDIYVVPAEGGKPRQLTTNPSSDNNPQWSPDGKWIAYVANTEPKSWAAKSDIMVVSAEGGTARDLTKDLEESTGAGLTFSPDGKSLYFSRSTGVYSHLFSVPAAGGAISQVTKENRQHGQWDFSDDGTKVAFVMNDPRTPPDVWVVVLATMKEQKITDANPQLEDFAISETEVVRWKGADGWDIEGVLTKPLDYAVGKRYPLILQIHGGPYGAFSANFNSRNQIFAANGYAILEPNPRGSTGYGHKFTIANVADWGGKDFDDDLAGVDAMVSRGIADSGKLVVMGGSYGGFSTFWAITQTDRFKAAIGHAGISDWYSFHGQSDIPGLMEYGLAGYPWTSTEIYRKYSPMTYVDRVKTPIMITHGEQDRRVPIAQAEEYYRALQRRGVEVVFVRYPREGHGIQEPNHQIDLVHRQLEWFDKHLGITRVKPKTQN
jgi:dipeptidyl aminopeptidase/acylaminoacyl peptidase